MGNCLHSFFPLDRVIILALPSSAIVKKKKTRLERFSLGDEVEIEDLTGYGDPALIRIAYRADSWSESSGTGIMYESVCNFLVGCGVYPQSILLKNPLFIIREPQSPEPDEGTNRGAVENHRRFSVHGAPFDFSQDTPSRSFHRVFQQRQPVSIWFLPLRSLLLNFARQRC